ncbi:MAG: two-component system response regulator OmpR [Burkholderiales bacterium]|jgi:two-component system phosphate regulon response regulator OmpR|nr:two-component system response regulator OmpR [Burkholderiales bacterium]
MPETPHARILVVDDDRRLRDLLHQYLSAQGFGVQSAPDGPGMDRALGSGGADLIVLDLMLPGEDGMSICRRLRSNGNPTPIIMLTAKGDDAERIEGLETGADDYLPKPFNPRELVARINAVLRRGGQPSLPGAPAETDAMVRFGPFTLNLGTRRLLRGEEFIPLTTGEFALLKALVTHAGTPLTRERLMELARGREYGLLDRTIDVQVSRLRKLIENDPAHPLYLQTVWGHGYVFVIDRSA